MCHFSQTKGWRRNIGLYGERVLGKRWGLLPRSLLHKSGRGQGGGWRQRSLHPPPDLCTSCPSVPGTATATSLSGFIWPLLVSGLRLNITSSGEGSLTLSPCHCPARPICSGWPAQWRLATIPPARDLSPYNTAHLSLHGLQ